MWIYYDTEKPLPDDPESLAFQIGANAGDVRLILNHFFSLDANAMRTHKRIEREIEQYRARSKKASASANARWKNANAMRTHSERNANERKIDSNQEPITNNQEKKVNPVAVAPVASSGDDGSTLRGLKTFRKWLEQVKANGETAIPSDDPIFAYADDAGIPEDFLLLAWREFKTRYLAEDKKYKDWRNVFRKAVREDWMRLWRCDAGTYSLTSKGQQAMQAMRAAQGGEA